MSQPLPFYPLGRAYAWSLVALHYRRRVVGGEIPKDGPLIQICNHNNGLVDGALQFELTRRPLRILAKYTLLEIPGLGRILKGLGAIPVYRQKDGVDTSKNAESFRAISAALHHGGSILMFPEGESRFHHNVRSFKTGAARMVLQAEELGDFQVRVQVVPVGISYDETYGYRSNAWLWVGEPQLAVHMKADYEDNPRIAVRTLLSAYRTAQRAVTVELDQATDHRPVCMAERLVPDNGSHVPGRRQALAKRFGELREADPEATSALTSRLAALSCDLERRALCARELSAPPSPSKILLRFAGGLLLWTLLLPALLLAAPPFLLTRTIAFVSPAPRDKVITIALLLWSIVCPIWGLFWVLMAGLQWGWTGAGIALACVLAANLGVGYLWQNRRMLRNAWSWIGAHRVRRRLGVECDELRERLAPLP